MGFYNVGLPLSPFVFVWQPCCCCSCFSVFSKVLYEINQYALSVSRKPWCGLPKIRIHLRLFHIRPFISTFYELVLIEFLISSRVQNFLAHPLIKGTLVRSGCQFCQPNAVRWRERLFWRFGHQKPCKAQVSDVFAFTVSILRPFAWRLMVISD